MKKILIIAGAVVFSLSSCLKDDTGDKREDAISDFEAYIANIENSGVNLEKTDDGVYYELKKSPIGETPEVGDMIVADITSRVIGGRIYFTTNLDTAEDNNIVDENYSYRPYRFFYGYGFTFGFHDALSEMGDSAELDIYVPTNLGYDFVDYGSTIPAFSNLMYNVKIHNTVKDPDSFETGNLKNYLATNDIAFEDSTDTGIYFEWIETSTGDTVKVGDKVKVKYKGYFLDGVVFDETTGDNTFDFTAGTQGIIHGFNAGVLEMREGSKAKIIIPYQYAYGADGKSSPYFPPYSTIIFDVELVEIE
jgi:FKBP-type peptidyl-prolyl cis-trans isomerase